MAVAPTKSGLGESCNRRLDCSAGLLCLERACRAGDTPNATEGPRRGGRGESCVASNDCELGMGCVAGACRERVLLVPHVTNECHRVECVAEDDCCKDFRASDPVLCDELDESCKAGVQSDCNLHASICTCRQVCDDSICVASVACNNDLDCGGSGVLRCFAGKCAQCATDSDCNGVAACISGLCRAGCNRNEECPIFSECKEHRCEHVGCRSDRECFFESGSPRSKCVDHVCKTPCESDVACSQPFHGCVDRFCTLRRLRERRRVPRRARALRSAGRQPRESCLPASGGVSAVFGRDQAHRALGERADGERRVDAGVGRDRRAVDHVEAVVAEHAVLVRR